MSDEDSRERHAQLCEETISELKFTNSDVRDIVQLALRLAAKRIREDARG